MTSPTSPEDPDLVRAPLPTTIDRDHYTPALIHLLANHLLWSGSRVFRHRFGLGTNDWRIISALGNHPGASARELCKVLGMNKSVASKSVNLLLQERIIAQVDGPRGSRQLYLTRRGAEIHDQMLAIALERERIAHNRLSGEEVQELQRLLLLMLSSVEDMQEHEQEMTRKDP